MTSAPTAPRPPLIDIQGLTVAYDTAAGALAVVDIPAWSMLEGALVVIEGPSGCGKSTFLNVLGGLLPPSTGRAQVCGVDLATLDEAGRDRWRADQVGIIFQGLNLLQGFTALENVMLGLTFSKAAGSWAEAAALLAEVGLGPRTRHRPSELSLGEQQRVAIARALVKRPRLILADEPTGSLDPRNASDIAALLRRVCADHGCSLVMVCHQPEIAAQFPQRVDFTALNRVAAAGVAP
jgi:ABC-type lipoprotein export system ATPase subunit